LQAQLNLGYLDDVSLGGSADSVASDVVVSDAVLQSFNRVKIDRREIKGLLTTYLTSDADS